MNTIYKLNVEYSFQNQIISIIKNGAVIRLVIRHGLCSHWSQIEIRRFFNEFIK